MIYLLPFFGDGPIWNLGIKFTVDGCKIPSALLQNFFFVNNLNSDLVTTNLDKVSQYSLK